MTTIAKATITTVEELPGVLRTLKVRPIVYFVASNDESGKPWCPDCQKSDPIVNQVLDSPGRLDWGLIRVLVGSKEEWKTSSNPFKQTYKLKGVPTLGKWTETGLSDKVLVEEDLFQASNIEKYLNN